jgi:5-formyltetrahydrofolate cyclo-ligase
MSAQIMKKSLLRQDFLTKRLFMRPTEADQKNKLIAENTAGLVRNKAFSAIHVYLPLRDKNEIDTWQIIANLRKLSPAVQIVVPRVVPETYQMHHFLLTEHTTLVENRWKIPEPEPTSGTEVRPESIDIVLLPLLAFDTAGYRVGYGGGFYDRFLQECKPDALKIGLSFFEPVEQIEDIEPNDLHMDYCVTPDRVWKW